MSLLSVCHRFCIKPYLLCPGVEHYQELNYVGLIENYLDSSSQIFLSIISLTLRCNHEGHGAAAVKPEILFGREMMV